MASFTRELPRPLGSWETHPSIGQLLSRKRPRWILSAILFGRIDQPREADCNARKQRPPGAASPKAQRD